MRLEQVVRPFQSRALFGERRIVSNSVKKDVQPAGVTWGAVGDLPVPVESPEPGPAPPWSVIVKGLNQKNVQQPAKDEWKFFKIQQEGNPDNFVIEARLVKATFKDPKPQYLKAPETPAGTTAKVKTGPTSYKPGPGIVGSDGTPMPDAAGEEIPLPGGGPRGDALAYNRMIDAEIARRGATVKIDTHEFEYTGPPLGPNEIPL